MNESFPSPDGIWRLELGCNEFRMSLWACSPMLYDTASGKVRFEAGSSWDAFDIQWQPDSARLTFGMRRYPNGLRLYQVTVLLPEVRFIVTSDGLETTLTAQEASAYFV